MTPSTRRSPASMKAIGPRFSAVFELQSSIEISEAGVPSGGTHLTIEGAGRAICLSAACGTFRSNCACSLVTGELESPGKAEKKSQAARQL